MFTNAGIIFFAKNPTRFLIQNYITCIAFKGTSRVYILDTLDCNKDIITNIEDALVFAKKHINLTYLINAEVMREQGNATRKEVLEITEDVLKEGVYRIICVKLKNKNNSELEAKDFQPTTIKCRFGDLDIIRRRYKLTKNGKTKSVYLLDIYLELG